MKASLKISVFLVALVVMSGCSAQKRAERHVRKAVALCPELVQTKARPIDTVLTVPGFADCTGVSLESILELDTIFEATNNGTFVISLNPADSVLRVGFIAAPQKVHYRDTLSYAQVVMPKTIKEYSWKNSFLGDFLAGTICVLAGFFLAAYLILKKKR